MNQTSRQPHRRYNPLTGEWVLVSPQRTGRPWQGEVERPEPIQLPRYDPQCYLCPGNARAGGARNPVYEGTFEFENDFAALRPDANAPIATAHELLRAQSETGLCRVLAFTPRHDLSIATMSPLEVRDVVDAWTRQYVDIGAHPDIAWVQIFENRGAMMGASSPHPHSQVWAEASLPNEAFKEQRELLAFRERTGRCLLCEYAALELREGERVVYASDDFVVVVPFWATWPFEVLVLPCRHVGSLDELRDEERDQLAIALTSIVRSFDALFGVPFPYSMGFHQRPTDDGEHSEWHLHAHYYPPLLRSATVRKFMVGYELLAQAQRDVTPEDAAARLRQTL